MKTILCALNSKYIHSALAPWYLAAAAQEAGLEAQVFEGTVNEPLTETAARLLALRPDVIGFSCYIWNITAVRGLCRLIRAERPDVLLLLGGPEAGYNVQGVLDEIPEADFILSGEGEGPLPALLTALAAGETRPRIPGVSLRGHIAPPHIAREDPPDPYSPAYFAALEGRIAYLEGSRGCAFSCAYCLSAAGGGVRFFDLARVKGDILRLARSGARTVKFVDRTFNIHRERALEIFRFILDRFGAEIPAGVRFHFEIAGDLLDPETLAVLAAAPPGLFQLEIGLQSFHGETLRAVNRETDIPRLRENVAALMRAGNIHVHLDLIAGLPHEDMARLRESFNTAYSLSPHMLQLGFLKLLHGAPMREEPARYPCAYDPAPPYTVTETPWLSRADLQALHAGENALDRLCNSGRFRRTLSYVLAAAGMSPFDLLMAAGALQIPNGISLDDYTARIFAGFSGLPGVDPGRLRDVMVSDRLATNASGKLPKCLKLRSPRLPLAARALGVNRGYALLPTEDVFVYADYTEKNPVTGAYPLVKIPLAEVPEL